MPSLFLPPGPSFLLQNLPSLVLPPLTVLVLSKIFSNHITQFPLPFTLTSATEIPTYLIIALAALSLPTTIALRIALKEWKDTRDARRCGAVMPPRVRGGGVAGVRLLKRLLESFRVGYCGELFSKWFEESGAFLVNSRILYENRFITAEPDHIKAVLATQFESFEKGPVFQQQLHSLLGVGVFNSDGEMWKFHRAMTRPFFSKERIGHFDIFDRHAKHALDLLAERVREGYPVDVQDLTGRFTMDSATEFLFNKNVHSLSAGLPYPHYYSPLPSSLSSQNTSTHSHSLNLNKDHPSNQFAAAFDEANGIMGVRTRRGLTWRLGEFWRDEVEVRMRTINAFLDPVVEAAVRRNSSSGGGKVGAEGAEKGDREKGGAEEGESLLDHLARATDDQKLLRDETLNILLAGRDTTANTLTWAIYMLSQHPDVMRRLREEVLEQVGESRRPTFEDLKDMKYLRAVINETLRLYPAVPFNIRTSNRPVVLPAKNGRPAYYVPAGTKMGYSVFLMHRRTDLWGPDADKFDPDRFLDDRVKTYITPNPFIFLPFNAGPRICLGQQFAYHEASFFLIRFLQRFSSVRHVMGAQPPPSRPPKEWKGEEGPKGRDGVVIKSQLTMSVKGGVWVEMEEVGVGN